MQKIHTTFQEKKKKHTVTQIVSIQLFAFLSQWDFVVAIKSLFRYEGFTLLLQHWSLAGPLALPWAALQTPLYFNLCVLLFLNLSLYDQRNEIGCVSANLEKGQFCLRHQDVMKNTLTPPPKKNKKIKYPPNASFTF